MNMKAIRPTRSLNNAFKRFQRLPELPKIELRENRTTQPLVEARPLNGEGKPSGAEKDERFTKVLIG
jgi:hypothetical protein